MANNAEESVSLPPQAANSSYPPRNNSQPCAIPERDLERQQHDSSEQPWKSFLIGFVLFFFFGPFAFLALCFWDELKDDRKRKYYLLGCLASFLAGMVIAILVSGLVSAVFSSSSARAS